MVAEDIVDEARKCLDVARAAWNDSDVDKALRFTEKSLRLHETDEARAMLQKIKTTRPPEPPPKSSVPPATQSPSGPKWTQAQMEICNKVIAATDFYAVLSLKKNATEEQVKKAYRKLAMQLHPDKNSAPKAEEAFKKVSRAFQVLSDAERRHDYDIRGTEEPERKYQEANVFMSPEELFHTLFVQGGGVFYDRRTGRHHQRVPVNQTPAQRRVQSLVQLLPFIFILVLAFLNSDFFPKSPQTDWRVNRTTYHNQEVLSSTYKVPYYVGSNFERAYPPRSPRREDVEAQVEYAFYKNSCAQRTRAPRREVEYNHAKGNRRKKNEALIRLREAENGIEECRIRDSIAEKHVNAANRVDQNLSPASVVDGGFHGGYQPW